MTLRSRAWMLANTLCVVACAPLSAEEGIDAAAKKPADFCARHPTHHSCAPVSDTGDADDSEGDSPDTGSDADPGTNPGDVGVSALSVAPDITPFDGSLIVATVRNEGDERVRYALSVQGIFRSGFFMTHSFSYGEGGGGVDAGATWDVSVDPWLGAPADTTFDSAWFEACAYSLGPDPDWMDMPTVDEDESNRCFTVEL